MSEACGGNPCTLSRLGSIETCGHAHESEIVAVVLGLVVTGSDNLVLCRSC